MLTAYPLSWPAGWKRTRAGFHRHGQFNKKQQQYGVGGQPSYNKTVDISVADATQRVLGELAHMGFSRDDTVISSNLRLRLDGLPRGDQGQPSDSGVAVYWKDKQRTLCIATDQYHKVEHNLAAIAATLEAMRAIERHGGAEILNRAFTGFAALPEKASSPWREVLGFAANETATVESVEKSFRALALTCHPDHGGSNEAFQMLTAAREQARQELNQKSS